MDYEATIIQNPSLFSHLQNPDLAPPESVEGYHYVTCYDPASGLHLDTLPMDTPADVTAKINLAKEAQSEWAISSWNDRRRVLRSLLAWLVKEQEICARVACRDTGKTSMLKNTFDQPSRVSSTLQ